MDSVALSESDKGLPWWLGGKESACQCRICGFSPWVEKLPWRRKWQPVLVFLPGKSHGQRSLAGYSPWGHRVGHDLATKWQQKHSCFTVLCYFLLYSKVNQLYVYM